MIHYNLYFVEISRSRTDNNITLFTTCTVWNSVHLAEAPSGYSFHKSQYLSFPPWRGCRASISQLHVFFLCFHIVASVRVWTFQICSWTGRWLQNVLVHIAIVSSENEKWNVSLDSTSRLQARLSCPAGPHIIRTEYFHADRDVTCSVGVSSKADENSRSTSIGADVFALTRTILIFKLW